MGKMGYSANPLGFQAPGYDPKIESQRVRETAYFNYINHLYLLAVNRFSYENLPDSVSPRVLEQALIMRGNVLFFEDPVMGLLALPNTAAGRPNIYDIPKKRYVNTASGYHRRLDERNSVIMFNDQTLLPFVPVIYQYAQLLTDVFMAKRVNLWAMNKNTIIKTNKDSVNTIKQMLFSTKENGMPYVIVDDTLDMNTQVFNSNTQCLLPQLNDEKQNIFSEYLIRLGYKSSASEKRERQNIAESMANDEHHMSLRSGALEMRQLALEQVNRMFGTNISVDFNERCLQTEYLFDGSRLTAQTGAGELSADLKQGSEGSDNE